MQNARWRKCEPLGYAEKLWHAGIEAGLLRADVAIEVLTEIFLVVGIVPDLGSRCLEARLACNLRQVLILAIGCRDPLPTDELTTAFTFDGRTSRV